MKSPVFSPGFSYYCKMLSSRVVAILVSCLPFIAVGQVSNEEMRAMRLVRDLERESRPFRGYDNGPEVEGDPYYATTWNKGSVTIYRENKSFDLPAIKYDVLNYGVDILFDQNTFKSLDGNLVQSFEYTDSITKMPHRFVNGKEYTREGTPIKGFLEVLCWGKVDVYSYTEATLLRPNYNVAVGSGNKNYVISKKKTLLYSPGTELRPLSKKELSKIWAEKEAEMTKFQKVNKLNLSRDRDLMLMVDYFNTL